MQDSLASLPCETLHLMGHAGIMVGGGPASNASACWTFSQTQQLFLPVTSRTSLGRSDPALDHAARESMQRQPQ